MPTIAIVEGLNIFIYDERQAKHRQPHFHVVGADIDVSVSLVTLEEIVGTLPRNKRRKILEWARAHQSQLQDIYQRMQNDLPHYKIED
jgi:hypothetical protein